MKKQKITNHNDKLIEDCYNYIYEVICCNDYHSEQDMDEEILSNGKNLDKSLREMLKEKIIEAIDLSKEMLDKNDEDDIDEYNEVVGRGEKLLERLDLQKQFKKAKACLKMKE